MKSKREEMEKKYLSLGKKILYGMDDSAWCFICCIINSFMMIYLTDSIGLSAGVIGTLMLIARVFDGVSDIIFGRLLDKTHTKMGKARPWMLFSMIGCAIGLIALFSIPTSLGKTAQYAYFFVFYMLVNTIFYTSGYIAYSTLMSLITRNKAEQVQITSYRTVAGNLSFMILGSVTLGFVTKLGGGVGAWRTIAIIYAIIGIVLNTIIVIFCKELPETELGGYDTEEKTENTKDAPIRQALKAVLTCKYFYFIILIMVLLYTYSTSFMTSAAYYATYVLHNQNMNSILVIVNYGVTMVAALVMSFVVKKVDAYRLGLIAVIIGVVGRIVAIMGGNSKSLMILLIGLGIATIATAVVQTTSYTMAASTAEYIWQKNRLHVNGMVFSGLSMGIKIGCGIGPALCGILLDLGGYVPNVAEQSSSAMNMLNVVFLWLPLILTAVMFVALYFTDIDKKLMNTNE